MEQLNELKRIGRETADFEDRWLPRVSDSERERERFLRAPIARRSLTRRRVIALAFAAAVLGALALWFGVGSRWQDPQPIAHAPAPLAVKIGGTAGAADAWFAAQADKPLELAFSDGSSASFEPGARGRVTAVDAHGAKLLVENGRARFEIAHRPKARWLVQLGPFAIHVLGTTFDVEWDPAEQRLMLVIHEGNVKVTGCALGAGKPLAAGETLRALCRDHHWEIARSGAEPPPAATLQAQRPLAEATPDSAEKSALRSGVTSRAGGATSGGAADWQELARQGRYADAVRAAEALDFDTQCERLAGAQLRSLADTARLAGRLDRASQAYRTLRQRFAGQELASTAAFSLGRMAFDQQRAYPDAARWFEVYVRERPKAPLAREARGRLLEALVRSGDRTRAGSIAEQYLVLYPDGPHAKLARELVQH